MWPFKQKKIYKVTWSYGSNNTIHYTEIVKAKDVERAWNLVRRKHTLPIFCIEIGEVM